MKAGIEQPKKEHHYYEHFRNFCIKLHKAGITSEEYNSFHLFKTKMNIFHHQRGTRKNIEAMGTLLELRDCFEALKKEIAEFGTMQGEVQKLIEEYEPQLARLPEKFQHFLRKTTDTQRIEGDINKQNIKNFKNN